MKVTIYRKEISDGVLEWTHGFRHDQDYVVISEEDGRWAMTFHQGGLLLVDSEYAEQGELLSEWNSEDVRT